ncbi:MAG TPA: hypothetical protein PLQ54_21145, partial [Armatimonadota bacterium]|nr:hypothetical protein [Armatimonadota bacterium]
GDPAALSKAIETFADGRQNGATRTRLVERYRLTPQEWEVEAQVRHWGGSDRLFPADVSRAPDRVGDLHMKRLDRPAYRIDFHRGPTPSFPIGRVLAQEVDWQQESSPCAAYLGLYVRRVGALRRELEAMLQGGGDVAAELTEHDGREAVLLTLTGETAPGFVRQLRCGFVRLGGYAPYLAEVTGISEEGGRQMVVRVFALWEGYVEAPDGTWVPSEYRCSSFSTGASGLPELDSAEAATLVEGTLRATRLPLSDEELAKWFPMGTIVAILPDVRALLPTSVVDAFERSGRNMGTTKDWLDTDISKLVYRMDEPWYTGTPEERRTLQDALVADVMARARRAK